MTRTIHTAIAPSSKKKWLNDGLLGFVRPDQPEGCSHQVAGIKSSENLLTMHVAPGGGQTENHLQENGYPTHIVDRVIKQTVDSPARTHGFPPDSQADPPKQVYFRLPWIGHQSTIFRKELTVPGQLIKDFLMSTPE